MDKKFHAQIKSHDKQKFEFSFKHYMTYHDWNNQRIESMLN